MTQHLHQYLSLQKTDKVQVNLKGQANVMIMNDENYLLYRNGDDFDYFGMLAKRSPCILGVPGAGHWHLVIEQANPTQDIMAHVQIISQQRG